MTTRPAHQATATLTPAEIEDWREFPPTELSPLLSAALRQIVKHGYDAVSVRAIAAEVGVTVPALYYHFENKQAMLVALLDHAMAITIGHLEAAVAEAGSDPVTRLSYMVESIVLGMAHHPDLAFLDSERRSLTAENLAHYVAQRDKVEAHVRKAVKDGCRSGVFGTKVPETCARAILSACQGIPGWYHQGGAKTPAATAAEYVTIALAAVDYRAS